MPRPRTIGDVIAARVRSYRKGRGWSIKTLAEECARLGAPQLTEASLTNIERGQGEDAVRKGRDVTVEELVILGYALAVPPLLLAVPLGENEPLAITATARINPHLAWRFITGEEPPMTSERTALIPSLGQWSQTSLPVLWFSRLNQAQEEHQQAEGALHLALRSRDGEQIAEARRQVLAATQDWAKAVNHILSGGLQAPEYSAAIIMMLKSTGLIKHPERLEIFDPESDRDGEH